MRVLPGFLECEGTDPVQEEAGAWEAPGHLLGSEPCGRGWAQEMPVSW